MVESRSEPGLNGAQTAPELAKELLVEEIDRQVEEFQSESVPPGWSTWAILGSIAVGAWLAMDLVFEGDFSGGGVGSVVVLVVIVVQLATLVHRVSVPPLELPGSPPRFEWLPGLTRLHLGAVVLVSIWLSIAVLSWQDALGFPRYVRLLIAIYAVVLVLSSIGVAALSHMPVPVAKSVTGRGHRWVRPALVHGCFLVPAAYGVASSVWTGRSLLTLSDCRLGGLFAVGLLLIEHLVSTTKTDYRIEALRILRLELVLERVSPSAAAAALEALCSGLQTSQALEPWTRPVLERCSEVRLVLAAKSEEIDQVVGPPAARKTRLSPAERVHARAVHASVSSCLDPVRRTLMDLRRASDRLHGMAMVAQYSDPSTRGAIATVLSEVRDARTELEAHCKAYDERAGLLQALLDGAEEGAPS